MFPKEVKESVVRITAIQVAALTILSLFIKPFIGLLAIDFATRAFIGPKYSLLGAISRFIDKTFNIGGNLIAYPPKKFAAQIGFAISLFASIFVGVSLPVFYVLAGILILFALLEGIFGFCMGCKLYWLMNKLV